MLERLRESVNGSPVMGIGGYSYFIHPVTDGIPRMAPELLSEIADAIMDTADLDCDVLVCPESMGIHIAVPVSLRTGIPYSVIRKRRYGLPGETAVRQNTGYSERELYINGIDRGDRVVVLDDVLSTGGTMGAVLRALADVGAETVDAVAVFEKGGGAKERLYRETGIRVKTLLKVDVVDGRTVCID